MMYRSRILIMALALFTAPCFQACWTDTEQYKDFVCERLGGDFDNDGFCSLVDCNDKDPNIYPGAPCDDNDPETEGETLSPSCECGVN